MKVKRLASICLGALVAVSSMATVFAQETETSGNEISTFPLMESEVQPRSFDRKWGDTQVTGAEWAEIYSDVNTFGDRYYQITLKDDGGSSPLYFLLQIFSENDKEEYKFSLEEGETITYVSKTRGSFILYAQYDDINTSGTPSGRISLGRA